MRAVNAPPDVVRSTRRENGFTLAEILLTIGVVSVLLTSLAVILQDLSREEIDIATASHLDQLALGVEDMVNDLDQFDALYAQMIAAGGVLEIPANEIVDPEGDGLVDAIVGLAPTEILPENFRFASPIRQDYSIVFFESSGGTAGDVLGISYLILADERTDPDKMREITRHAGSQAGYYSGDINKDGAADTILGSAYGVWRVPLSRLNGSAWHSNVTSPGNEPSNADGWYLAYYGYINQNHAAKDYLYREARPGLPQLHTMYDDLNMAGQNIIGADNVYVQNLLVNDSIVARGSALLQGALGSGDMIIDGSVLHDGRAQLDQITQPNAVIVQRDMLVTSNLTSEQIDIQELTQVTQIDIDAGNNIEVFNNLNMAGNDIEATDINATEIVNLLGATTINTRATISALSSFGVTDLTISGGDLAVFDFVIQGDISFDLSGGSANAFEFRGAIDASVVNINNLRSCNDGCAPLTVP